MIDVLGLNATLAGLAAAGAEIEHNSLPEGLEAAGEVIRSAWVRNIVDEGLVLTGNYRDSIRVERDGEEVKVLSDVPYAPILEHGDSRQVAHPVAQRALDETAAEAISVAGARVRGRIK